MSNIASSVNMSFRVNKNLKEEADKLFKNLGLNTSVALNMFLNQSVRDQCIPFMSKIDEKEDKPSKRLLAALKQADIILENPTRKGFNNIDELIKALDE